jgi:hypothetical protein
MVIFHSYVSLPEGSANNIISIYLFMAILEKIYIYISLSIYLSYFQDADIVPIHFIMIVIYTL